MASRGVFVLSLCGCGCGCRYREPSTACARVCLSVSVAPFPAFPTPAPRAAAPSARPAPRAPRRRPAQVGEKGRAAQQDSLPLSRRPSVCRDACAWPPNPLAQLPRANPHGPPRQGALDRTASPSRARLHPSSHSVGARLFQVPVRATSDFRPSYPSPIHRLDPSPAARDSLLATRCCSSRTPSLPSPLGRPSLLVLLESCCQGLVMRLRLRQLLESTRNPPAHAHDALP